MQGAISLDNSVGTKIYRDGTVSLDCLVEMGSYRVSLDDLSI